MPENQSDQGRAAHRERLVKMIFLGFYHQWMGDNLAWDSFPLEAQHFPLQMMSVCGRLETGASAVLLTYLCHQGNDTIHSFDKYQSVLGLCGDIHDYPSNSQGETAVSSDPRHQKGSLALCWSFWAKRLCHKSLWLMTVDWNLWKRETTSTQSWSLEFWT